MVCLGFVFGNALTRKVLALVHVLLAVHTVCFFGVAGLPRFSIRKGIQLNITLRRRDTAKRAVRALFVGAKAVGGCLVGEVCVDVHVFEALSYEVAVSRVALWVACDYCAGFDRSVPSVGVASEEERICAKCRKSVHCNRRPVVWRREVCGEERERWEGAVGVVQSEKAR